MAEYSAGHVDGYADGDRKVVVCGELEVGVFRIGDEFYAWHNRCAHRAGPVCPWHGYEYSIKTGFHQGSGRVRLRKAELAIRDGEIYVSA